MARESAFQRLQRHFHEHPHGRRDEFLFWAGLGVGLGAITLWGHLAGWMALPYVLMLAVLALCLFGWAFLPQRRPRAKAPTKQGKRGQLEERKKAAGTKLRRKPPPKVG